MLAVEGDTFKTLGEHIRMQQMSNHAGNTNAYHRISHESNDVMTTRICLCFHRKFCRPLSRSSLQQRQHTHTHKTQEETKEHEGTKSHHNATTVLYARNPTSLSLNSFLSQFSPANISKNLFDFVIVVCYCVPLGWCFNMLQSFMKLYVLLGREWSDMIWWFFFALHALHAAHVDHVARLRFWRSGCARDHCMGFPGSCEDESRLMLYLSIFDHVFHVESHVNKICRSNDMAHPTNNFAKSCNPTADTHRLTTTASLSDASMGQWPIRQFF